MVESSATCVDGKSLASGDDGLDGKVRPKAAAEYAYGLVACGVVEGFGDFDPSTGAVDVLLLQDDSDVASGGACSAVGAVLDGTLASSSMLFAATQRTRPITRLF